ncbi:MAG: phytoene/squalene synthase family protein, partial [Spirochaetia bacterium]|nr:phytoene/squalene synthase family protein [Spirochaetia bacterium]
MVAEKHEQIFRSGSKTYYFSSRFFPPAVRKDVYVLYGFVRTADNLVDTQPVDPALFHAFRKAYSTALGTGEASGDIVIDAFLELQKRKQFDPAWTEAFLDSMEHDLVKSSCDSLDEVLTYIYGSAEVIGLYMAKIMDLEEEAFPYAAMLGRAMQYINFIRDIQEDNELGRRYLPLGDSGLSCLEYADVAVHQQVFSTFLRTEIKRYQTWQKEAEKGYRYIPRRYRIPIMTAADMYCWTAQQIALDPMIVYRKRVKPPKTRILRRGFAHSLGVALPC